MREIAFVWEEGGSAREGVGWREKGRMASGIGYPCMGDQNFSDDELLNLECHIQSLLETIFFLLIIVIFTFTK